MTKTPSMSLSEAESLFTAPSYRLQEQDLKLLDPIQNPGNHFSVSLPRTMFRPCKSMLLVVCCVWFSLRFSVDGSVHEYRGEKFISKGNAFIVHGGSEGIYSTVPGKTHEPSAIPASGDSYIRFDKIAFRRPEGFANFSSGLVHAIVFEVEDRDTTGGSAYGGQRVVCCSPESCQIGRMF